MTAAAYGPAASRSSLANRSTPATSAEKPRAARRVGVEAEAQDAADGRASAPPAARGRPLRHCGAADADALAVGAASASARGSWSAGTNQPGCDSPSRPVTSVRSRTSLTVQSGAVAVEPDQLEVDDLAADVEERDRVAVRRPDRRPGRAVVGEAQELAPVRRVEDDDVGAEAARLRRGDVPAVGRPRRVEVAAAGQRGRLLRRRVLAVDAGAPRAPSRPLRTYSEQLAVRPPGRVLVAERRVSASFGTVRLLLGGRRTGGPRRSASGSGGRRPPPASCRRARRPAGGSRSSTVRPSLETGR